MSQPTTGYMNEFQRQNELKKLRLVVRVVEARGLKAGDFLGTSDPFVELRIKNHTEHYKTKTIKKTTSPFWNEEFILNLASPELDVLQVKVYDYDSTSNNDLLGEMEVPVSSLMYKPGWEEWRQLCKKKGHTFHPIQGEIKLQMRIDGPTMQQGYPTTTSTVSPNNMGMNMNMMGQPPMMMPPMNNTTGVYPPQQQPVMMPPPQQQPMMMPPQQQPVSIPVQTPMSPMSVPIHQQPPPMMNPSPYPPSTVSYPTPQPMMTPPPYYPPQYPPNNAYYPPQYPPMMPPPVVFSPPPPTIMGTTGFVPMVPPPMPMMTTPMMTTPMMGTPMMSPMMPTTTFVTVPQTYTRTMWNYSTPYDPYGPFMIPVGLPPHLTAKMMQASNVFRMFDTNRSGGLSKKEWKRAMWQLGYHMSKHDAKRLFYMIDRDHSGRISEREFCEYWISTH